MRADGFSNAHEPGLRLALSAESAGLDVKLNEDTSLPLADELIASGVPVILVSGYDSNRLPNRFADTPKLGQPVSVDELAKVLGRIFQRGSSPVSG